MKHFRAPLSDAEISQIAAIFESGGIVLIPTDTVYGVACASGCPEALSRIRAAKGRDAQKPFQLLASHLSALDGLGLAFSPADEALASRFWPGALTLVLDAHDGGTEGVRIPKSAVARIACAAAGGTLRCTSANLSGQPPALTAAQAEAAIPSADAIIDDGPCAVGMASSVVKTQRDGSLKVFREEALSRAELESAIADASRKQARWIWLDPDLHPSLQNTAARRFSGLPLPTGQTGFAVVELRKDLSVPVGTDRLHIEVSADTSYRLYVNDTPVAEGPTPSPGDWRPLPYPVAFFADALDVRLPLQGSTPENSCDLGEAKRKCGQPLTIRAIVRMGEIHLCETSCGHGGFWFAASALAADGSRLASFASDESWRIRLLPAWENSETFNGAIPPGKWETPRIAFDRWGVKTAPIKVRDERFLQPLSGGTIHIDAAQEHTEILLWPKIFAGRIFLHSDGPCKISASTFETSPDESEKPFLAQLSDSANEVLLPLRSVGGVRLSLKNLDPDSAVNVKVGLLAMQYPFDSERAGLFECSEPGFEKVWQVCRHTLGICLQNLHLDSPRHQEMLACTGDYAIETRMTAACYGDFALAEFDVWRTALMLEATDGRLFHTSYSLIWVLWLADVYRFTGNKELVGACRPALEALLRRFRSYLGENGIVENPPDWMFVDWLVVQGQSLHHPPRALGQTVMNAFLFGALLAAADLFEEPLGDAEAAAHLRAEAATLRNAVRLALFDCSRGLWRDGMDTPDAGQEPWRPANISGMENFGPHSNILASLFGLSDGEEAKTVLRAALSGKLGPIQPYFAHWALEAADKCALFGELGMPLLRKWIPEAQACPAGLAEGWHKPEPTYSFDHSHAWGGTPAWQLPVRLLGLRIEKPGFASVSIAPELYGLKSAHIRFPTPLGAIDVILKEGCAPEIKSVPDGMQIRIRR